MRAVVAEGASLIRDGRGGASIYDLDSDPDEQADLDAALAAAPAGPEDFVGQLARYADTRAAGAPPPVTLADARTLLEVLTAMYVSSRADREIALPLPADHPALDPTLDPALDPADDDPAGHQLRRRAGLVDQCRLHRRSARAARAQPLRRPERPALR
jgi:hypothetical protein